MNWSLSRLKITIKYSSKMSEKLAPYKCCCDKMFWYVFDFQDHLNSCESVKEFYKDLMRVRRLCEKLNIECYDYPERYK